MNKIWQVYQRDFKRLSKNVVAMVVAMGICILPALYAWFNIAANWDPYGNTDGIKVAVVNQDESYTSGSVKFAIGSQIIDNLKKNDQIGWTFVNDNDAIDGVRSGKYYAAIVIPADFSQKMSSILSGKIQSPNLKYYVNEKKNAIAPKITDKGASAVTQQVNATFISVATETVANVLNVTASELNSNGDTLLDRLVGNLRNVSTDLNQYGKTVHSFAEVSDGVAKLTKTARLTIPDVKNVVKNSNNTLENQSKVLKSSRTAAGTIATTLGNVMNDSESTFDTVAAITNSAIVNLEGDATSAANTMDTTSGTCDQVIKVNTQLIDTLTNLKNSLPDSDAASKTAIQGVIDNLKNANVAQTNLKSQVQKVASNIRTSATTSEATRKQIQGSLTQGKKNLKNARTSYQKTVQPQMSTLFDNISMTTSSISGLLSATNGSLSNLDQIFAGVDGALASGKAALNDTEDVISNTQKKLGDLISCVESVNDDEQLNRLVEVLKNDPELTGNFMSAPVQLKTTSFYKIENYGSAMAPFYSVLAIWVGAIVLVAIMKVNADEDEEIPHLRPHQAYLGRYLTFMTFGLIQATIIALGDLLYLEIQCEHPLLFFLCAWVCSFVFTNIVYALTVSFGAIGKAMSVILLVIQIGGSGGTFPIEVTPPFFQIVNPFMPFTHGINGMRECVAGLYKLSYWLDLRNLILYVPFALLLGLFLRKPLMNLTRFFEQRLEDSKLL